MNTAFNHRRNRLPWSVVRAAAVAAGLLLTSACGPAAIEWTPDPALFDGARAFEETARFVAVGPKHSGSPGAERAAEHIAARLTALGYTPETDAFEDRTPLGPVMFRNVLASTGGAEPRPDARIILLGAHYDTKYGIPDFVGANDSGSGVGALLELARVLNVAPPPPGLEVRFAFLDGEEARIAYGPRDGLHGSRRLAARAVGEGWATRVNAVVILDMIGDRDLQLTLPRNCTPALVQAVFRAARAGGERDRVRWLAQQVLDDHVPFMDRGMPAVNLIDFEYGTAPGLNDLWHTPNDTLDRISPESLALTGRLALRLLGDPAVQGADGRASGPSKVRMDPAHGK
jgi:glutaminyl-peptide cyclotransferase